MKKTELISPKYYPFNDKYDTKKVFEKLKDLAALKSNNVEYLETLNTLYCSLTMHDFYKKSFEEISMLMKSSKLTFSEICSFSISAVNRGFILIGNKTIDELDKKDDLHFEDFYGSKIDSFDPAIGKINVQNAVESQVEGLDYLLNFARYLKNDLANSDKKNIISELEQVSSIKKMIFISTLYSIVKSLYDDCIFNFGYCLADTKNKTIYFRFNNKDQLILKRIGFVRLQRNAFSMYFFNLKSVQNSKIPSLYFFGNKLNAKRRIKKVELIDGLISFQLAKGVPKNELDLELKSISEFTKYHHFIEDINLPELPNLTILDLLSLFNLIQHLFRKIESINIDDSSIYELQHFSKFPSKIDRSVLVDYLKRRSKYSHKQIISFLELLINRDDKRISFYEYPLLQSKNELLFPLITINHPMLLVLIDRWLEDAGFDIEERGKYLEQSIRDEVIDLLTNKGYRFVVPKQKKFRSKNGENEEIDLIINLKSICIVAEIKCIKYPLEERDESNAYKRLSKGAQQVNRKSDFLIRNASDFETTIGSLSGKKILNLVITNYTLFSGYKIHNVNIVDFIILNSYFGSGAIKNLKLSTDENKTLDSNIISEDIFYRNEDEFNNRIIDFFASPNAIESLRNKFEIQEKRLTPEKFPFIIKYDAAVFK